MYRVFLVIGTRFYLDSLMTVLPGMGDITVVGAACEAADAFPSVLQLKPDVVLLDAGVGGSHQFARALSAAIPDAKVVVVAIQETASSLLGWAEIGVAGFVTREQTVDHLIASIVAAARGELHCSPQIGALLLHTIGLLAAQAHRVPADQAARVSLTHREQQIMDLIGRGLSNKRIASELGISVATAKNHVHNVLNKLSLHRRSDAAALLRENDGSSSRG